MPRVWKFSANVDTDQMVPGRFAPYMRPGEDVGNAAFIEAHPQFNREALPGDIIAAGNNFGCGSSREYAPLALKRRGIAAIIAPSFARIFFRNAVNLGIPLFEDEVLANELQDADAITLDWANHRIQRGPDSFALPQLPAFASAIVTAGGIAAYIREHGSLPACG